MGMPAISSVCPGWTTHTHSSSKFDMTAYRSQMNSCQHQGTLPKTLTDEDRQHSLQTKEPRDPPSDRGSDEETVPGKGMSEKAYAILYCWRDVWPPFLPLMLADCWVLLARLKVISRERIHPARSADLWPLYTLSPNIEAPPVLMLIFSRAMGDIYS
jgi:hypothetical protein